MAQEKQEEIKKPKRFYEPKCPSTCDVYEWQVDEDGHHIQKKVGVKDFDAEIQLYKDSCDIKILVDRINKQPELLDILKQQANAMHYGDVNDYPQEYHPNAGADALKMVYENQPDSIKSKFQTYDEFKKYFENLTEAVVTQMFAPKEEAAQEVEHE